MPLPIKPVWTSVVLAFGAGTLIGALAAGGLHAQTPHSPAQAQQSDDPGAAPVQTPGGPPGPRSARVASDVADRPDLAASGTVTPGVAVEDARIAAALAAATRTESRLAELQVRLARVERALASRPAEAESERPSPPRTPQERRDTLVSAGVDTALADDIVAREGRRELDRLDLRDLAVREGWIGSDRYRSELERLADESEDLRGEIGDAAYDRMLYLSGEDNRVRVAAVIPGSAAEAAGLEPGDLIESYAGERLFAYAELRERTSDGERGELVAVRVRRGSGVLDAWVPRGPLGVRLEMTRAQPSR